MNYLKKGNLSFLRIKDLDSITKEISPNSIDLPNPLLLVEYDVKLLVSKLFRHRKRNIIISEALQKLKIH